MPTPTSPGGNDHAGCPVETIVSEYLRTARGDPTLALRCAVTDALSDLMDAERCAREHSRLISRGFVRGRLDAVAEGA